MIEQLKKALTTGVGLALKTWAEVEAAGKEVIQKAELSEKDASPFLKSLEGELRKDPEEDGGAWSASLVKDVLKKADIATER
ncbi:MAG: hypothetical protein MZV70_40740 [Desulfobacterales bacterium]|nr:hypothetical protein [Desulfobacterales bacterium]